MKNLKYSIIVLLIAFVCDSCLVSYKLSGASIDYSKTKTISITDFPNTSESVYPPLAAMFSEALRDKYSRQTRLNLVKTGGDLDLEGEITGYNHVELSIGTDALSSETRLTLTVNVRFSNAGLPEDDFEKRYSASQTYNSRDLMLSDAQEQLLPVMIEEICSSIYNDTVAKW